MTITIGEIYNLPTATRVQITPVYAGKGRFMSNGRPVTDIVYANPRDRISITWVALPDSMATVLRNAWDYLTGDPAPLLMTNPPMSYTWVTRDPSSPDLTLATVGTASGIYWATSISLMETGVLETGE